MSVIDAGVAAILIVAAVNGFLVVHQLRNGGDPFGYFNAAFISTLWAIGMAVDNRRSDAGRQEAEAQ